MFHDCIFVVFAGWHVLITPAWQLQLWMAASYKLPAPAYLCLLCLWYSKIWKWHRTHVREAAVNLVETLLENIYTTLITGEIFLLVLEKDTQWLQM